MICKLIKEVISVLPDTLHVIFDFAVQWQATCRLDKQLHAALGSTPVSWRKLWHYQVSLVSALWQQSELLTMLPVRFLKPQVKPQIRPARDELLTSAVAVHVLLFWMPTKALCNGRSATISLC